ncbi:MAG: hypothetical protein JSS60_00655 [Verrucomicrobia bacterium]|nr:hypothetical protein [Verrucomicrobiota bacterium]
MKKMLVILALGISFLFSWLNAVEIDAIAYKEWWLEFRNEPMVPSELKAMEDYFVSTELLTESSKFWLFLNKMNIEQIVQFGFDNFKQTVACNYFTWVVNKDHQYSKNLFEEGSDFLQSLPASEIEKNMRCLPKSNPFNTIRRLPCFITI